IERRRIVMLKWIAPILAAVALVGCQKAPEEKTARPEARPVATLIAPARPAPQPEIIVTNAERNLCKNSWVAAQAAELKISTAEVERRARFMRATPTSTVTVHGVSTSFTKSVWHSCGVAIEASRRTEVQAAPAARDPNLVTLTRQQYNNLRAAAYKNPEESDPAKLLGYREDAARLEVERDNLLGFTPMHGLSFVLGLVLGAFSIWFFNLPIKTRTKRRRDLPREDPRPTASEPDPEH
ncbi:MAG: hypothetical protein Q8S35_01945, partial [bacterium]|nr:hypothetical protein [bacterium]